MALSRRGRGSVRAVVRAVRRSTSPACSPAHVRAAAAAGHGVVDRRQHRQRVDQVRGRDVHQDAALDRALVGDRELALGEVAQAAVDELGRPARRAEGEVVGVDREHGEAAGDRVEGDAGAGDAEADDHHVDLAGDVRPGRRRCVAPVRVASGLQRPRDQPGVLRVEVGRARPPRRSSSCAENTKPWPARVSVRAIRTGSPARIAPDAWPLSISAARISMSASCERPRR